LVVAEATPCKTAGFGIHILSVLSATCNSCLQIQRYHLEIGLHRQTDGHSKKFDVVPMSTKWTSFWDSFVDSHRRLTDVGVRRSVCMLGCDVGMSS